MHLHAVSPPQDYIHDQIGLFNKFIGCWSFCIHQAWFSPHQCLQCVIFAELTNEFVN